MSYYNSRTPTTFDDVEQYLDCGYSSIDDKQKLLHNKRPLPRNCTVSYRNIGGFKKAVLAILEEENAKHDTQWVAFDANLFTSTIFAFGSGLTGPIVNTTLTANYNGIVGNSIEPKGLNVNFQINRIYNAAATNQNNPMRMRIIVAQHLVAIPSTFLTANDGSYMRYLLQDPVGTVGTNFSRIDNFYNCDNMDSFVILEDRTYDITWPEVITNTFTVAQPVVVDSIYISKDKFVCDVDWDSGQPAAINTFPNKGAIMWTMITSEWDFNAAPGAIFSTTVLWYPELTYSCK